MHYICRVSPGVITLPARKIRSYKYDGIKEKPQLFEVPVVQYLFCSRFNKLRDTLYFYFYSIRLCFWSFLGLNITHFFYIQTPHVFFSVLLLFGLHATCIIFFFILRRVWFNMTTNMKLQWVYPKNKKCRKQINCGLDRQRKNWMLRLYCFIFWELFHVLNICDSVLVSRQ